MNTLFDEQNNAVAEFAQEAKIPTAVFDQMIVHHEGLLMQNLEDITSLLGGVGTGDTIRSTEGIIDHTQFEVINKEEHA